MSSIKSHEIAQFQKDSLEWWNENGPFAPLHKMNPARLTFIRDDILKIFAKEKSDSKPYKGLSFLDIGCGGGLLCEPLARLGGSVTGVDADNQAIEVAARHKSQDLDITYINGAAEDLVKKGAQFDVVCALEIVEHVDNPKAFLENCASLVKPGGLLFVSTINRTAQSLLQAKFLAEYVLRWVPAGTHDWKQFMKPSEVLAPLEKVGLKPLNISGIGYTPLRDEFFLTQGSVKTNYILSAQKPA
ncbi:MAG: bifunctional 2-polyprenyl-6-hydroxyphenol methylase/3-demethylubiquinol 3-O-methyltransferase UbiG [Pseudobdellovibrionaceae bacterium]